MGEESEHFGKGTGGSDLGMKRVIDLFNMDIEIPGNLAKVQVIQELINILQSESDLKILDVGCGPTLEFWKPLLNIPTLSSNFMLYGIDFAEKIKEAQAIVEEFRWGNVKLREGSGYELSNLFEHDSFDIIVSTQVLEHIRDLKKFCKEMHKVCRFGGLIFLTLDSAHYQGKYRLSLLHPKRSFNRLLSLTLSKLGKERYHDFPLYDSEVESIFKDLSFRIVDKRFYNIHPLKQIHNHKISQSIKNKICKSWKELEDLLNTDRSFVQATRNISLISTTNYRR